MGLILLIETEFRWKIQNQSHKPAGQRKRFFFRGFWTMFLLHNSLFQSLMRRFSMPKSILTIRFRTSQKNVFPYF
ncbi:hypothetical protein HMPREF9141_0476 [Prevotella multiformis DSM 16608]|uniref:Uncharacterized protein n=1 Tax=Prevotella multiformis DSM 16608 TaxID=888743 RepID=F0F4G0_9BACT|nr:hypothetical protein HMPREF9141_0476 [Prevotella multiformis DSM 16608]